MPLTLNLWAVSSVGRALPWHGRGRWFESSTVHQLEVKGAIITNLTYLISIVLAELAGFIGAIFTAPQINTWYQTINKPTWNPPGWLFAPVWIILYLLMGWAAAIIFNSGHKLTKLALGIYAVQLIINLLWSFVFFGSQSIGGGLIVITTLLIVLGLNFYLFLSINRWAGILLLPYLAWVTFATILNLNIWLLN